MKSTIIYEIIGWIGVACVLLSYCLLSLGITSGESIIYHVLILLGSVGVAGVSIWKRNFQPAVLNICFALLSVIALVRLSFS